VPARNVDERNGVDRGGRRAGEWTPTIIPFKPARAKFVRLTQTAPPEKAPPFSIQQLRFYRSGIGGAAATK
jgi:hypothetical protein